MDVKPSTIDRVIYISNLNFHFNEGSCHNLACGAGLDELCQLGVHDSFHVTSWKSFLGKLWLAFWIVFIFSAWGHGKFSRREYWQESIKLKHIKLRGESERNMPYENAYVTI